MKESKNQRIKESKFQKIKESKNRRIKVIHTYLAQTPEIGQGLERFLSCGARKQEQT